MIPRRFRILRPYLASFVHSRFKRPPLREVVHWLTQPDKEHRASRYIQQRKQGEEFLELLFRDIPETFYYPLTANYTDLCQTVDEVFNPLNWHHFVSQETPIDSRDTVVDCGAAEGLFSFFAANHASKVYAVEPIPLWQPALKRTFQQFENVKVLNVGLGHRNTRMRMTDNEIYSHISATGSIEIPIATLDSLFAAKNVPVSFIKADIEGFEFPMLIGAEELIRANRPKISMTMYHGPNHFLEVQEFLLNIHPDYRFRLRGIAENGNPVLLQAY